MSWQFFTSGGSYKQDSFYEDADNVGVITPYAGSTAPDGWLFCQGQEVSRATYPKLASVIGVTYGPHTNGSGGSGITHFRLPDLRGRSPVGTGKFNGSVEFQLSIGSWGGKESVTLGPNESGSPSHTHPITYGSHNHESPMVSHTHAIYNTNDAATYDSYDNANYSSGQSYSSTVFANVTTSYTASNGTVDNATAGITSTNSSGSVAASESHPNMQPFVVLNFIIKT